MCHTVMSHRNLKKISQNILNVQKNSNKTVLTDTLDDL